MKFVTSSALCILMFCTAVAWSQNRRADMKRARDCSADCTLLQASTLPLTALEIQYLSKVWQEEKLALDVYTELGKIYDLQIFANIAASEQRHLNAVTTLLDRYGVPEPNPQDISELVTRGSADLAEALLVGVFIEEDISDLAVARDNTTRRDIKKVYSNLLLASLSHLEAFENAYEVAVQ